MPAEVLFHHLLIRHQQEMLPVVCAPTVGDACRCFSEIAPAVAKAAVEDGVAPEATEAELRAAVSATQWMPQYAWPQEDVTAYGLPFGYLGDPSTALHSLVWMKRFGG